MARAPVSKPDVVGSSPTWPVFYIFYEKIFTSGPWSEFICLFRCIEKKPAGPVFFTGSLL